MIKPAKITTGNVGEWSELYVLAFILANGGVFAADRNQEKRDDLFYKVLQIVFESTADSPALRYEIGDQEITIKKGRAIIGSVKIVDVKQNISRLFEELTSPAKKEKASFSWPLGEEMLNILIKKDRSVSNKKKKDIEMILLDMDTQAPSPKTGFSIKSQIGSPATLVNASKATNFIFEILDSNSRIPALLPEMHPRNIKDNVCLLVQEGYNLSFKGVESKTFNNNLLLIDSNLPEVISKIVVAYYSRKASKVSELSHIVFGEDGGSLWQSVHKIKEFLTVMGLGMVPDTGWDGMLTSLGGLLIVKKDGNVLCYYLHNMKDFHSYLFENTKLETASTSRHDFGKVYKEGGRYFIKLNFQVRFEK